MGCPVAARSVEDEWSPVWSEQQSYHLQDNRSPFPTLQLISCDQTLAQPCTCCYTSPARQLTALLMCVNKAADSRTKRPLGQACLLSGWTSAVGNHQDRQPAVYVWILCCLGAVCSLETRSMLTKSVLETPRIVTGAFVNIYQEQPTGLQPH